jgi:GNAT superfamily N-acetyltransferase
MTSAQPSFEIRPITEEDRAQWEELFLAYGRFYETDFTAETVAGVWAWFMDKDHLVKCFVAAEADTLLGFAHLREQADTFRAGPSWFLDDLFTSPTARGRGVATALIATLVEHGKTHGGGDLRWITARDNLTAQRLYDTVATKTSWVMYERDTEAGH